MLTYWQFSSVVLIIQSFSQFTGTNPCEYPSISVQLVWGVKTVFQTLLVVAESECELVWRQTLLMHGKFWNKCSAFCQCLRVLYPTTPQGVVQLVSRKRNTTSPKHTQETLYRTCSWELLKPHRSRLDIRHSCDILKVKRARSQVTLR